MPPAPSIQRRLLTLACFAAVALIAGIAGYMACLRRSAPPPLALPAAKEVCFVVARGFNSQWEKPDLAPFLLPPDSFPDVAIHCVEAKQTEILVGR